MTRNKVNRNRLLGLAVALVALLVAGSAFGAITEQWSKYKDSYSTGNLPTSVGSKAVYYRFDSADVDSTWLYLDKGRSYTVCLDPDTTATTAGATVKIWGSISSFGATAGVPSFIGAYIINGVTLTGTYPAACIYDVPGGVKIAVEVVANAADAYTSVVSVVSN